MIEKVRAEWAHFQYTEVAADVLVKHSFTKQQLCGKMPEFSTIQEKQQHMKEGSIQSSSDPSNSETNMQTTTPESKARTVTKECLQPLGAICRCIDDRALWGGDQNSGNNLPDFVVRQAEFTGPQFLGGSLGIMALVAEEIVLHNPDAELLFDDVYSQMLKLHQDKGLLLGVHMDDHHGEMSSTEIADALATVQEGVLGDQPILAGCGFAGLLSNAENPLGLSPQVAAFFQKYPNIVDELVRRGAKLSILTGHHAEKGTALAVENLDPDHGVDIKTAIANGVQTYDHDTGVLQKLLEPTADDAPELLKKNAVWLRTTTNILAGMDPISLTS